MTHPNPGTDQAASNTPHVAKPSQWPRGRSLALVIITGVCAGFLSGLFGVGGGLVIVPALMAVLGMDQRRASATSLVAIVLTAVVGAISYASTGQISLIATAFVVVGALVGSQIGVWLLRILPDKVLPWIFVGFAVFVIVSQQFQVPVREGAISIDVWSCAAMILVGLLSGILSGLVGVGGGAVIVPGLELVVGAGDLLARGTSLLAMIPTALAGTYTNFKHRMVDLCVGVLVGIGAAATAPVGTWIAGLISPETGNILFAIFLVCVIANTLRKARKQAKVKGKTV
ncbi:sulfite exporter TauE/SafE family protein [Schaalia vaccimaxillae]|uniref:sulfite exporter TauE/SafE family protein n=1 Tax=Schaalia vaccimaxillae TaxID=183916 RepID=UPI0003B66F45|nr:sulfite exporter TauE/SafE family protein [Schaalia vaccimaxillae]